MEMGNQSVTIENDVIFSPDENNITLPTSIEYGGEPTEDDPRMEASILILFIFGTCCFLLICCRSIGPRPSAMLNLEDLERTSHRTSFFSYYRRQYFNNNNNNENSNAHILAMSKEEQLKQINDKLSEMKWTTEDKTISKKITSNLNNCNTTYYVWNS